MGLQVRVHAARPDEGFIYIKVLFEDVFLLCLDFKRGAMSDRFHCCWRLAVTELPWQRSKSHV